MLHRIPGFIGRLGTAARRNVGTSAGSVIALDSAGKLPAVDGSQLTNVSAGSVPGKNIIIDPAFTINQRGYVSAAALSAGSYGHDRWKAGASGGDYSFTQLASSTQITIAANKSLIQVVENTNVVGGSYVLSWTGTAVARVGVDSATPSGNFAASPIVVGGQTAGTTMSVEFTGANAVGGSSLGSNTGTLGTVQLETGIVATPFEVRHYGHEMMLCQRYYWKLPHGATNAFIVQAGMQTGANSLAYIAHPVEMRTAATVIASGAASDYYVIVNGATVACTSLPAAVASSSTRGLAMQFVATATIGYASWGAAATSAAKLEFSAEL